jgi:hypothetical protein
MKLKKDNSNISLNQTTIITLHVFFVSWQKGIHNVSGGIKIKFGPNSPVGHLAKLCSLNPSTYQKVRQMALILE